VGTPIILDCDPGHDDAIAILLAAASPAIDLLAITTVGGNGTLEKVTRNARIVCTLAGIRDVPIAAGCARPLAGDLRTATHVHGESALDGADLPEPDVPLCDEHATDLLRRVLTDHPEPVTLVPVGPLTNIATVLRDAPGVAANVREIVLMGGSTARGNITPLAEFNIWVDPEAADIVMRSGIPVTICGLNATHQALATREVRERVRAAGGRLGPICADLLEFFGARYAMFDLPDPPVHDPVAVARVIDPSLVRCVPSHVAIELRGEHTRGATVCDLRGVTGQAPNAQVAVEVDVPRFWDHVVAAIEKLA
jgi:inosine-uridine nucleoside N-ribohydrolase